ncbi:hypothetical protein BSZ07_24850, partial [Streptomyces sp. M1013]
MDGLFDGEFVGDSGGCSVVGSVDGGASVVGSLDGGGASVVSSRVGELLGDGEVDGDLLGFTAAPCLV